MYSKHSNTFVDMGDYVIGIDTKGRQFKFDKEDMPVVNRWYWYVGRQNYVQSSHRTEGKRITFMFHREVMNAPDGYEVDHINHDPTDCRKSNMRICTHKENSTNRRVQSNNKARVKGVNKHPDGGWRARIKVNGVLHEVNGLSSCEEAAAVYRAMAIKYHGEYACM